MSSAATATATITFTTTVRRINANTTKVQLLDWLRKLLIRWSRTRLFQSISRCTRRQSPKWNQTGSSQIKVGHTQFQSNSPAESRAWFRSILTGHPPEQLCLTKFIFPIELRPPFWYFNVYSTNLVWVKVCNFSAFFPGGNACQHSITQ